MKKIIAYTIVITVVSSISILSYIMVQKMNETSEKEKRISTFSKQVLANGSPEIHQDSLLSKPLIISYFNTECRYCQAEIKSMREHSNLQHTANILLISDQSEAELQLLREQYSLDTTQIQILRDADQSIRTYYGVKAVPATFVYAPDSSLVYSHIGEVSAEGLTGELKKIGY